MSDERLYKLCRDPLNEFSNRLDKVEEKIYPRKFLGLRHRNQTDELNKELQIAEDVGKKAFKYIEQLPKIFPKNNLSDSSKLELMETHKNSSLKYTSIADKIHNRPDAIFDNLGKKIGHIPSSVIKGLLRG